MANKKKTVKNEGEKSPSKTKKTSIRKTSDQEQREWEALYFYVKKNILQYDDNMDLTNYCILRLKGMAQGRFAAQDRKTTGITYGYKVVLSTFEQKQELIRWSLQVKTFNSESHKINWIFKIIENNINDVYLKMREANKHEENQKLMNIPEQVNAGLKNRTQVINNSDTQTQEPKAEKTWDDEDEQLW